MSETGASFRRGRWRASSLDAARDRPAVVALWTACADYALLTGGTASAEADAFFAERPPGLPGKAVLKLGLREETGALAGLLDVARGYPAPDTWYVGLLLLRPEARGRGGGRAIMNGLSEFARCEGAARLRLCVLEENPRALRFWRLLGFREERRLPPARFGTREHVRIELARALA